MTHWNKEIDMAFQRGYTAEAMTGIRALEAQLDQDPALGAAHDEIVRKYAVTEEISMTDALAAFEKMEAEFGMSRYSLEMLLLLNGLPALHEKYRKHGLSDTVYYDTVDGIRAKVNECIENKGVVGTFVAWWCDRYFKLTCFAFGCMEYELKTYEKEACVLSCGHVLKPGDQYVNMHIPARGIALTDEARMASYRAAYAHFAPHFEDGRVLFGCSSWLLYPRHLEFLPNNMNMCRFLGDFHIVSWSETEEFGDKWRVFGKRSELPLAEWPRDTRLRAAYADWLLAGNRAGKGVGVFLFDGEKIMK